MDEQRLDRLRFQADHKGMTPECHARLLKQGVDPDASVHGAMVTITITELQEFLKCFTPE